MAGIFQEQSLSELDSVIASVCFLLFCPFSAFADIKMTVKRKKKKSNFQPLLSNPNYEQQDWKAGSSPPVGAEFKRL